MRIDDILNSLPTKEDLAAAIGLQARRTMAQDIVGTLGIFGTGILLGAGLGLLLAPKAGVDLRQDLVDRVNGLKQRFGNDTHTNAGSEGVEEHVNY